MTNGKYVKGARQEREIVNYMKKLEFTAIRSAGSKSKIDIVVINHEHIYVIQSKASPITGRSRARIRQHMIVPGWRYLMPVVLSRDWKEELSDIL